MADWLIMGGVAVASRTPRGDEMQMTLGTQALHKAYVLVDCVGGGGVVHRVISH